MLKLSMVYTPESNLYKIIKINIKIIGDFILVYIIRYAYKSYSINYKIYRRK